MFKNKLFKLIITLIIFPTFIIGQTVGGGLSGGGGVLGGGKVDNVLKKEVTTVFNKKIFTGLGQKIGKNNNSNKLNSSKKNSGKIISPKSPNAVAKKNSLPMGRNQSALTFVPTGDTGFDVELAQMLTQEADEQEVLLTIFRETKKAFNEESQKLGRKNDVALATTFFIAACITVYHQSPDPSDEATEALYNSLADEMLSSPETAKMSNQEKQLSSDKLIYLGGLILGGYLISKESGDQQTIEAYRKIAAACFQEFTNLNVAEYEFTATGLKLKS